MPVSVLGVWMWPDSLKAHGTESTVARCARMGVTDLFFLTKGLAGTASYASEIAPCEPERDLLRELLDCAHRRGIRVHAWLTSASDEHYKALHPESGRCHLTHGKDKGLISLTDAGYLDYMQKVVRELCGRYAIDGLHLDYIRYNHLMYGWDESDQARYAAAGADLNHVRHLMERTFLKGDSSEPERIFDALRQGDPSVRAVAQVRREDVRRFAQTLCSAARTENEGLTLSAALMPEGAYEDTAFADLHYGQSYEDAAALYDFVLPMAYSQAYEKDGAWVRQVAEGTLKFGVRVIMGLHAYDGGTAETLRQDLAALKGLPIDGVCLFREGAFVPLFSEGDRLTLYNALNCPLTSLQAGIHSEVLDPPIQPGEERSIDFPWPQDEIRVFSGETEVCVYVAGPSTLQQNDR